MENRSGLVVAKTVTRIEEPFGWSKTIGGLSRPMLQGEIGKLGFILTMASYNLIRLTKLIEAAAWAAIRHPNPQPAPRQPQ